MTRNEAAYLLQQRSRWLNGFAPAGLADGVSSASRRAAAFRSWNQGAWAACAIFLLGFFALNIFTLLGSGQPRLPGLYSTRAATIGDGIMLPVLAYSLAQSVDLRRFRKNRFQTAFSVSFGALGLLTGAGVEVYDLSQPSAPLDWTFPAPHRYNLPGWYHTVFLVLAAGFFGWAFGLALIQLREESRLDPVEAIRRLRSVGCVGALFPGLAFVGLLEEDTLTVYRHLFLIVLGTVIGLSLIITALLAWACGPRMIGWCARAALGAMLPAIALCVLFWPGQPLSPSAAVIAAIIGLVAIGVVRYLIRHAKPGRIPRDIAACLTASVTLCAVATAYGLSAGRPVTASGLVAHILASLVLAACQFAVLAPLILRRGPLGVRLTAGSLAGRRHSAAGACSIDVCV
jgi:hypothetical protein